MAISPINSPVGCPSMQMNLRKRDFSILQQSGIRRRVLLQQCWPSVMAAAM
jgi:hypothetical protein